MPLPRIRFTIRTLVIAVALIALNLAAIIATPKVGFSPRGLYESHGLVHVDARWEYGVSCTYARRVAGPNLMSLGSRARIVSVARDLEPTGFQVWSRVIASASLTVLVLTAYGWNWGSPRRGIAIRTGGEAPIRRARAWLAARLMMIIIALIALTLIGTVFRPMVGSLRVAIVVLILIVFGWDWGAILPRLWPAVRWGLLVGSLIALNLAGAAYRPSFTLYEPGWSNRLPRPPRGFDIWFVGDFNPLGPLPPQPIASPPGTHLDLDYSDLFEGPPRTINLSVDGTLVQRSAMEVDLADLKSLPGVIFQDSPIGEATIDFGADGRVVSYSGRPGKRLSRPRVLRSPSFSFLEMRWPLIASASITLLSLVVMVRRLNPREVRDVSLNTADLGTCVVDSGPFGADCGGV